jgi:hypothetical protein
MKLKIFAAVFPTSFILASARSTTSYGSASYTEITTVSQKGPTPTVAYGGPVIPTASTPAMPPNMASYQLNSSFEITNKPVTRTFNWNIA